MALWNEINCNLTLTGKEYDGKGFGLIGFWDERFYDDEMEDRYFNKGLTSYYTFINGKEVRHVVKDDTYNKNMETLRNSANVPWSYEFGTRKIKISEDKINNCVYLSIGGTFRSGDYWVKKWVKDYDPEGNEYYLYNGLRNWFIGLVKDLINKGWRVKGNLDIRLGGLLTGYNPCERYTVSFGDQLGLEYKIASVNCKRCVSMGPRSSKFRNYRYYLHDTTLPPEYLNTEKIYIEKKI